MISRYWAISRIYIFCEMIPAHGTEPITNFYIPRDFNFRRMVPGVSRNLNPSWKCMPYTVFECITPASPWNMWFIHSNCQHIVNSQCFLHLVYYGSSLYVLWVLLWGVAMGVWLTFHSTSQLGHSPHSRYRQVYSRRSVTVPQGLCTIALSPADNIMDITLLWYDEILNLSKIIMTVDQI